MAFTRFEKSTDNISKLSDRPNQNDGLSSAQLKGRFDKAGNDISEHINEVLIEELESTEGGNSGADQIGATPVKENGSRTVQGILSELQGQSEATEGNVVHKTGHETIGGVKTFNDGIKLSQSTEIKSMLGYIDLTVSLGMNDIGLRIKEEQDESNILYRHYDGSYYKMWHALNHGHNSGLDADKLDGAQGSDFVKKAGAETITGAKTFSANPVVPPPTINTHAATKKYVDDGLDKKADLVGGKVPAEQLPSYVDDVLEYANLAAFPATGETGKIYVTLDTNKTYRWSGTDYVEISASLALGETSSTAYRGDRGKIAYDHSQITHAPSNAQKNSDITKAEIEAKLTGVVSTHGHTVSKSDVGLSNADNTSDVNKPISTAQQNALDTKAPLNSPALTGTPTSPTPSSGDNSTKIATTAYVQDAILEGSGGGCVTSKRVSRFTVGTSTAGWTSSDCDYLCDGTDDQAEINAAITALPAAGGEIVILDGTYNITAKIDVTKDNVSIVGNGNATILKRMFNSTTEEGVIMLSSRSGCKIADLQVDGNKGSYTNNNNYGISLFSSNNNIVTGNTYNNNTFGIYLFSSSNNTITGNACNSNYSYGISLFSSNSNTITGNTCNNNVVYGISLFSSSDNNTVTGNAFNNNNYNGIYLNSSSNNTITGNTCIRGTGLTTDYTASQHTIWLYGTGNNYNLISNNNCMGKAVTSEGGTGNTLVNNKYDGTWDNPSDAEPLAITIGLIPNDNAKAAQNATLLNQYLAENQNKDIDFLGEDYYFNNTITITGSNKLIGKKSTKFILTTTEVDFIYLKPFASLVQISLELPLNHNKAAIILRDGDYTQWNNHHLHYIRDVFIYGNPTSMQSIGISLDASDTYNVSNFSCYNVTILNCLKGVSITQSGNGWANGNFFDNIYAMNCVTGFSVQNASGNRFICQYQFADVGETAIYCSGSGNLFIGKVWDASLGQIIANFDTSSHNNTLFGTDITPNIMNSYIINRGSDNVISGMLDNTPQVQGAYKYDDNDNFNTGSWQKFYGAYSNILHFADKKHTVNLALGGSSIVYGTVSRMFEGRTFILANTVKASPASIEIILSEVINYAPEFGVTFNNGAIPKYVKIEYASTAGGSYVVAKELNNNRHYNVSHVISAYGGSIAKIKFSFADGVINATTNPSGNIQIGSLYLFTTSQLGNHYLKANGGDIYGNLNMGTNYLTIGSVVSLPTASSTYRGQIIRLLGNGTSTADKLYICILNGDGTYAWKEIFCL